MSHIYSTEETFMKPYIRLICLAGLGLSLIACQAETSKPIAQSGKVASSGQADIGGAYTLLNQDGETVTQDTFLGQPQLIYFGFSYCPDICPTALIQMGHAQKALGIEGKDIQNIFISVDPERDTPESLKLYVTANGFPEGLVGLTGSQEQVDTAKAAFKVYAAKVDDPEGASGYTVDHSSIIYFMDSEGQLVDFFTHTSSVSDITDRISAYLKQAG